MRLESIVSVVEIETWRSPQTFLNWFDGLLSTIHAVDDAELRRQLLLHRGLAKKIYEEVFPLYRLVQYKQHQWSSVSVRNILGNQPFDVEIDKRGKPVTEIPNRLEITYAVEPDYFNRMQYMVQHGHTNMTGNVSSVVQRGQKMIQVENAFKLIEDTVNEVSTLVQHRINKKNSKGYAPGIGLIIYVEDFGTFQHSTKDWIKLEAVVNSNLIRLREFFQVTYLIRSSDGKMIES
jgi:hypothetical protein